MSLNYSLHLISVPCGLAQIDQWSEKNADIFMLPFKVHGSIVTGLVNLISTNPCMHLFIIFGIIMSLVDKLYYCHNARYTINSFSFMYWSCMSCAIKCFDTFDF